ncbi:MAG: cytochrome d ubiquinol oxidase subunit II [Nitrosomonadales bacterium]
MDIQLLWACILSIAIFAYVILDGFDLGIGLNYPFLKSKTDRDVAMNSVAPIWDGNETWLVLGGGGLFAAFPLAYSIVLPALYAPLTAMLIGLILRGVAFEFRWKNKKQTNIWDLAFFGGSFIATFFQGVALGAFIQGIPVIERSYSGGWWNWLSPFSIVTGFALVLGYGLLGSTWLIYKTENLIKRNMQKIAIKFFILTLFMIAIVSIWTPYLHPEYFNKWFAVPQIYYVLPVPLLVSFSAFMCFRAIYKNKDLQPFLWSIILFLLSFIGLMISIFPHIVPPQITIWDAAAPEKSLKFLLVGVVIFLPIIIAYTAYTYWVFRGKVNPGDNYH